MIEIADATQEDHAVLLGIARQSKWTKDFSNAVMFSSPAAYSKGWIRAAWSGAGVCLGFTCVRHKVRTPETVLYFIAVNQLDRRHGAGRALFEDLMERSPSGNVSFNVGKDNVEARAFYERIGCTDTLLETIGGTATRWVKRRG